MNVHNDHIKYLRIANARERAERIPIAFQLHDICRPSVSITPHKLRRTTFDHENRTHNDDANFIINYTGNRRKSHYRHVVSGNNSIHYTRNEAKRNIHSESFCRQQNQYRYTKKNAHNKINANGETQLYSETLHNNRIAKQNVLERNTCDLPTQILAVRKAK